MQVVTVFNKWLYDDIELEASLDINSSVYFPEFDLKFNHKCVEDLRNNVGENIDVENYLSKVEKYRNKFINKYNASALSNIRYILIFLVLSGVKNKDIRLFNIGLKIISRMLDKVKMGQEDKMFFKFCDSYIKSCLENIIQKDECNSTSIILTPNFITAEESMKKRTVIGAVPSIVVFSPNPYSNYTLSVLALLKSSGIQVDTLIVRNIFSFSRFKKEIKRDGIRLIKKIYRKLIVKDTYRVNPNSRNLSDTKNDLGIKESDAVKWCRNNGVKVIRCETLNDATVIDKLKNIKASYGIFTGGGILKKDVLKQFEIGVLNCHAGILPHFRGMDVIEWPYLLNRPNDVGATVHFMSEGIDEGKILYGYRLNKDLDILSARYDMESIGPYLQVSSLIDHINRDNLEVEQSINDGKNYYVMHPWVFSKAKEKSNTLK
jgi:methionyl-tRNA formyltransferase